MDADDLYFLWYYAAVDAGGRCCKISFLLRSQASASCKTHVLGECHFPCTDAALGNRRCCFTQKNRIFPISLRASGWCCIDRYPHFSIAELEKAYFLGFDAPTLNQYLLFGVADILFIIPQSFIYRMRRSYTGRSLKCPANITIRVYFCLDSFPLSWLPIQKR